MDFTDIALAPVQEKRQGARMITLASGKGGVGKSSIAVNLAIALSQLGSRVLVVDADFGLANIDIMLGAQTKYNLTHFLRGDKTLEEIVHIGYDGVRFVSGGSGSLELLQINTVQLDRIKRALQTLDMSIDYILLDAGAGIHETLLSLIGVSSETLVITTPEPTAILDAYALVKAITTHDAQHPIRVIMNQAENKREADRVYAGFAELLQKNLDREVSLLGHIVSDTEVTRSIKAQTPVMIASANAPYSRDIRALARTLMELPPQREYGNAVARIIAELRGEE